MGLRRGRPIGWLMSWGGRGRASPDEVGGKRPADLLTLVDPVTGEESFRIPAGDGGAGLRALPVSPLAVMQAPNRLEAVLPDVPPTGHDGAGSRLEIAVAFSRPVAAFGTDTESIEVSGGELVAAGPLAAFGRPAHAWRLVLVPAGGGPMELRFIPGVVCTEKNPGICTADGTRLRGIPDALTIPGPAQKDTTPKPGGESATADS